MRFGSEYPYRHFTAIERAGNSGGAVSEASMINYGEQFTLILQANEPFLYYRKGGLAMYVLSKYIGKEKVNGALWRLLQKRHSGKLPLPTTLDLYQELQMITPESLNYFLHDLFKKNTYWRLKTKRFAAEKMKAGNWQVTLKVQAQKVVVDSTGNENEVSMNDWLEVGIYEKGYDSDAPHQVW